MQQGRIVWFICNSHNLEKILAMNAYIICVFKNTFLYVYIYQVALRPCDTCIQWLSPVLSQAIEWNSTDLLSIDSSGTLEK